MKIIQNRRPSFTLLELLVVISLIALLISILLPALSQARAVSQQTQCLANLRGLGEATFNYTTDNGNILPPLYVGGVSAWYGTNDVPPGNGIMNGFHYRGGYTAPNPVTGWAGYFTWAYWIWPYAPNRASFIDPAHSARPDPWDLAGLDAPYSPVGADAYYNPVGSIDGQFWYMNYGANPYVLGNIYKGFLYNGEVDITISDPNNYTNIDAQLAPSDTFMYMDCGTHCCCSHYTINENSEQEYVPGMDMTVAGIIGNSVIFNYNVPWKPIGFTGPDATYMQSDANLGRHPRKALNAVMVDGHAVTEPQSFVITAAEMNNYGTFPGIPTSNPAWLFYSGSH